MSMGKLYLVSDFDSELESEGLLIGSHDTNLTALGISQSIKAAESFGKICTKVHRIAASDAHRVVKFLHHVRRRILVVVPQVKYTDALRERDFGVLSCTKLPLSSDIFTFSRICVEKGESARQVSERAVQFLRGICVANFSKTILCVSHPFLCQIVSNVFSNRPVTTLTDFWQKKGRMGVFSFQQGMPVTWRPENFWDLLDFKEYDLSFVYPKKA